MSLFLQPLGELPNQRPQVRPRKCVLIGHMNDVIGYYRSSSTAPNNCCRIPFKSGLQKHWVCSFFGLRQYETQTACLN